MEAQWHTDRQFDDGLRIAIEILRIDNHDRAPVCLDVVDIREQSAIVFCTTGRFTRNEHRFGRHVMGSEIVP